MLQKRLGQIIPIKQKRLIADFLELTKFKLSALNAVGSYTMFYFHAPLVGVGLLETSLFVFATQTVAMSTQCFGQIKEQDKDALMARTKNRPMVTQKFTNQQACLIGTALSVSSMISYHMFEPFTWIVSNTVWSSYLLIYLPMKQKSTQNTLVGAVVGALPPFIGTFAQTGMLLDPTTLMLSAYIFSWQFPHFYGILYEHKEDYKTAGFIMTSNEDPTGEKKAFNQILACTVFNTMVPIGMAAYGVLHPMFLAPFMFYQVKAFQATFKFREEKADKKSSKNLKSASYPPFMILLVGFIATTGFNRFSRRRAQDEKEWPEQI